MKQNVLMFSVGLITLLVSQSKAAESIIRSDALYLAACDDNLELVSQLLARPDRQRFLEWESLDLIYPTALFVSIGKCKNLKITELLVKAGADVLLENNVAESPLKMALSQGGKLNEILSRVSTIITNVPRKECLNLWTTLCQGLASSCLMLGCPQELKSLLLQFLRRTNGCSFHDSLHVFVPGQGYIENINHIFHVLKDYQDFHRKKMEIVLKHMYRDKAFTQLAFPPDSDMRRYYAQRVYGTPDAFDEIYKSFLEEKYLSLERFGRLFPG